MKIVDNFNDLVSQLEVLSSYGATIFCIDGTDGSGKSMTATKLHSKLSWNVLNLDNYLENDNGSYVNYLKQELITNDIATKAKPLIIEGVCLLEVMAKLNISTYVHIYIKRIRNGDWIDQSECEFDSSPDETISKQGIFYNPDIFEMPDDDDGSNRESEIYEPSDFRREIITYHSKYKPHEKASVIYQCTHNRYFNPR